MIRSFHLGSVAVFLACAALAAPVRADERGPNELRLDLGGAFSFRQDDDRDGFGFGGAIEYERRLGRVFGLGARAALLVFPYDRRVYDGPGYASYVGVGPNLRLHLTPGMRRGDLWVAGGGQLVITGDLLRPGVDGGLGFDVGLKRGVAIGPFARYVHVFQPNGAQRGGQDGRMLFFGISLSWGTEDGLRRDETEDESEDADAEESVTSDETTSTPSPEDRDHDGVPDASDACPDQAASTTDGCPAPLAVIDADGDGVEDLDDDCPSVAGVAPSGCPAAEAPPSDRDGDGLPDGEDACPDQAASASDGCPPAGPADRDGDGVIDRRDRCPDEPAETRNGCPPREPVVRERAVREPVVHEPPPDRDGDGVADRRDRCPDEPAETRNGCPPREPVVREPRERAVREPVVREPRERAVREPVVHEPPPDRDGDGVADRRDRCPDEPAETRNGCPPREPIVREPRERAVREPVVRERAVRERPPVGDRDGDGVDDQRDHCPYLSGDSTTGCPPRDRDADGVLDADDRCPELAGHGADGCPVGDARSFGVDLRFETDRAALTDDTVRALLFVLERMRNEPQIQHVLVVGHADRLGEDDYNRELSIRRAENVVDWFARRGVARSRFETRGVGTTQPLVQGETSDELAPNRRVELFIVDSPATP